jgi:hypothetical protein
MGEVPVLVLVEEDREELDENPGVAGVGADDDTGTFVEVELVLNF